MIKGTYVKRSGPRPVVHRYNPPPVGLFPNSNPPRRIEWNHSFLKYKKLSRHLRHMNTIRKSRVAHDVLFSKKHEKTMFAAYQPVSLIRHRYSESVVMRDITHPTYCHVQDIDRSWTTGFDQSSGHRRTIFTTAPFSIYAEARTGTFLRHVASNPYEGCSEIILVKCKRLTRKKMRRMILMKYYQSSWKHTKWRSQAFVMFTNARLRLSTSKGIYHYWSRTKM